MNEKLVFAIIEHQHLGIIFEPFVVNTDSKGEFSLTYRKVNLRTINDHEFQLNDTEKKLFNLIDDYSDETVVKKFSKKKLTVKEFYSDMADDLFELHIRPYIEKRLVRIIDLIGTSEQVSLHNKGARNNAIHDEPIEIIKKPAEAVFNFVKTPQQLKYFLTLRSENKELSLTNKQAAIISFEPCWLFLQNKLYCLHGSVDGKKLIPFFSKEFIDVPKSSEKKYFETFIYNAVKQFNVNASGFEIIEASPQKRCFLKLEDSLQGNPQLVLFFQYDEKTFLAHEPLKAYVKMTENYGNYLFSKINRNKEWERDISEYVVQLGLRNTEGASYILPEKEGLLESTTKPLNKLVNWLNENGKSLQSQHIEIVQDFFKEKYFTGGVNLDVQIQYRQDWFDVNGFALFGEFRVPFVKLARHIIANNREYILPNGEIAIIPEEWFAKYHDVMQFAIKNENSVRLSRQHISLIFPILEENERDEFKSYEGLFDIDKTTLPELPNQLNATLRPYQLIGYTWLHYLHELKLGGCLADDMGLGKTLQTITLLLKIKQLQDSVSEKDYKTRPDLFFGNVTEKRDAVLTSLIVMPLSLIHNWKNEIHKFAPSLSVFKQTGMGRAKSAEELKGYDLVLTTYGVVRNDLDILKAFPFYYIILDESQFIKNPDSKIFQAVRDLNSQHKLVLTGTPVENSLTDLWSQMSFINPGLLGELNFFKREFQEPIERDNDVEAQERLKQIIEPFILRRTKQLVAKDLPALTEKVYYCEMTDEQQSLYNEKKSEVRNMILENLENKEAGGTKFAVLKALMQLRLLANHPVLSSSGYGFGSGKFDEVSMKIEELLSEGHKVLIFSQFVKHLKIFEQYFIDKGWAYSMLTGKDSDRTRKQTIEGFQNTPENRLFLISLKAGGTGLNLTSADYVFVLDPWWNPQAENQAISRAHRTGQDKKVFAYKFISKDSIEEKILQLQARKTDLANIFINTNNPLKHFTSEELLELFD
jgi:hypothetical protein